MACRSLERARVAADEIKQKTGVDDHQLIVMQLDVSSLGSVRSFVDNFKTSTRFTHVHTQSHTDASLLKASGAQTILCHALFLSYVRISFPPPPL